MIDIIEVIAEWDHDEAWSRWMKYMFSKGHINVDGTFTLSSEYTSRWLRQANTLYKDLSESEKESDRTEARNVLKVLKQNGFVII